jgi:cytoskeletal protein CcmA (bactofilin family)
MEETRQNLKISVKISGSSDIKGNLYGEEIKVSGGIKIEKDCECESFSATGKFEIKGLLNESICVVTSQANC